MAIKAATYDFTVQRRADHNLKLVFKDSNNDAMSLTGFDVAAQVWDESRSNKFADFLVTYTNRVNGIINISLTDTQTETFSLNELKYDVALTNPSGLKEYYLEGTIFVSEGYTA